MEVPIKRRTSFKTHPKEVTRVIESKPTPSPEGSPPRREKKEVSPETRQEIVRLHKLSYGSRRIADRVAEGRKVVRRILREEGCVPSGKADPQSKLTPFLEQIEDRTLKRLTVSRIYREIRELGYRGRRTILAEEIRRLQIQHALDAPRKKVKRRFETDPGQESQVDWSPFRVLIAGVSVMAYALTVILCCCRKLFVAFFRDERQHSLLEGLARSSEYFQGSAVDLVLDNMATAVLGRMGPDRKPIWHPAFLEFVRHYGINPIACAVRDPDRKGKIEKPFRLVYDDFLKEEEFRSWDDLSVRSAEWLDKTPDAGNLRVHGTTGLVPSEAYLGEREFLIRLPRERFPVYEDSFRIVDNDCTLSIFERKYSVPSSLANRTVPVRLFGHYFDVIDSNGRVAFSRTYVGPEDKRKLIIDRTHYAGLPRRPKAIRNPERLDEVFILRFPTLTPLVDGLKHAMKTLAPIHLRKLLELAQTYGQDAFLKAAARAQEYRRFDALAVERILKKDHPEPPDDPVGPLGGNGATVLGEVDPGSLEGYSHLDDEPSSTPDAATDTSGGDGKDDDPDKEGSHGA
jgi:transposase